MIINYFLILGVIVSVVFFLALLLNNISKLGRQSEKKDVIFTLLGFILAMSILVLFFVVSSNLEKEYAGYLKQNESYILVDADIIAKTDDFITVVANGELINILKTADAKEKVLPVSTQREPIQKPFLHKTQQYHVLISSSKKHSQNRNIYPS